MFGYRGLILRKNSVDSADSRAQDLRRAFEEADKEAEHENLYGTFVETIINRILNNYIWERNQNFRIGLIYMEWTQVKIDSLAYLRGKVAKTLKDERDRGEMIKDDLLNVIETDYDEFLVSEREAFKEKHHNWDPPLGELENTYLPTVKDAIQIVYRIFALFQIQNFTSKTKIPHLNLAHKMAKEISEQLLKDFSQEAMSSAYKMVTEIDRAYALSREKNCVGPLQSAGASSAPALNPSDLHCAYSICVETLKENETVMQAQASEHAVPKLKAAINGVIETGTQVVIAASSAVSYVGEKMLNIYIGNTNGPPVPKHTNNMLRLTESTEPPPPPPALLPDGVQKPAGTASIVVNS